MNKGALCRWIQVGAEICIYADRRMYRLLSNGLIGEPCGRRVLEGQQVKALLRKLKEVFRRYQSQPVDRVVQLINPVLRGWVNYFAVGHSSECFSFIKDWVEKKIRRHMGRSRNRRGFGWKRWKALAVRGTETV
jgi:hypothetical protein